MQAETVCIRLLVEMVHLLSPVSSCLLTLYLRLENWPQTELGFSFSSWPLPESEFRELSPFSRPGTGGLENKAVFKNWNPD